MRLFLSNHYNLGATGNNDDAVRAHGFIPLPQNWREAVRTNLVDAASANGLGNATACNGIGRPV